MWTQRCVLSSYHAFDRKTDTFLVASPRWHSMHRGNKTWWRWELAP